MTTSLLQLKVHQEKNRTIRQSHSAHGDLGPAGPAGGRGVTGGWNAGYMHRYCPPDEPHSRQEGGKDELTKLVYRITSLDWNCVLWMVSK